MSFALTALVCALLVGFVAGGNLGRLGTLSLRNGWLVGVGFGAQLAGTIVGGLAYPVGLALSALLVLVFLSRNRGVRGTGLVGLGLLSNALVVCLNGAMPVSISASGHAGISTQAILAGDDPRHELRDDDTVLPLLGDEIPFALPFRPEVVSVGDVLVASGLAQLLVVGMTRREPAQVG